MRAVLFHNVVAEPTDQLDRSLERLHVNAFRRELEWLASRYRIVDHDTAMRALDAGDPQSDAMVLTFDDGFAGVKNVAAPVLAELGLPAAVFVLTEPGGDMRADRLFHFERLEIAFRLAEGSTIDLTDYGEGVLPFATPVARLQALKTLKRRLKTLPDHAAVAARAAIIATLGVSDDATRAYAAQSPKYQKLTVDECRTLAGQGWTIGGHTRNHPSLGMSADQDIIEEVQGNADDLRRLGFTDVPFAFPYGGETHVDARARAATRDAGFRCAWTTQPGDNDRHTDRHALRRFSLPALHHGDSALLNDHRSSPS